MKDRVENATFYDEIDRIKDLINQLGSSDKDFKPLVSTGPSLTSKELNDIKEIIKKVAVLEDKTKNLDVEKIMKKLH